MLNYTLVLIKQYSHKLWLSILFTITNFEKYLPKIWAVYILNFLFFQLLNFLNFIQINSLIDYGTKSLNLIVILNSLILLGWERIIIKSNKIKIIIVVVSCLICFSFYSSYMLIINNNAPEWQLNFLINSMILLVLFKEMIALIMLLTGYFVAAYYLTNFYNFDFSPITYPLTFYIIFISSIIKYLKHNIKLLSLRQNKLLQIENNELFEKKVALETAYILHEISNPLHGITGITKELSSNTKLNKIEYIKQIRTIDNALSTISVFIKQLSENAELKTIKSADSYIKLNLIDVINNLISEQKFLNRAIINFHYKNIEPFIFANKLKIHQLLNNVLTNALKYGNNKETTISILPFQRDKILYWLIIIADQGEGILESELDYIFKPYTRSSNVSNKIQGTGLGLSLCREIVTDFKGFIWAENNTEGKGSLFKILLPQL